MSEAVTLPSGWTTDDRNWYFQLTEAYRKLVALPRDGGAAGVSLGPYRWECTEDFVDWCLDHVRIEMREGWHAPGEKAAYTLVRISWPTLCASWVYVRIVGPVWAGEITCVSSATDIAGEPHPRNVSTVAGLLVPAALLRASMTVPETVPQLDEE